MSKSMLVSGLAGLILLAATATATAAAPPLPREPRYKEAPTPVETPAQSDLDSGNEAAEMPEPPTGEPAGESPGDAEPDQAINAP